MLLFALFPSNPPFLFKIQAISFIHTIHIQLFSTYLSSPFVYIFINLFSHELCMKCGTRFSPINAENCSKSMTSMHGSTSKMLYAILNAHAYFQQRTVSSILCLSSFMHTLIVSTDDEIRHSMQFNSITLTCTFPQFHLKI